MKEDQPKWLAGFITKEEHYISDEKYIYCSEYCASKHHTYEKEYEK